MAEDLVWMSFVNFLVSTLERAFQSYTGRGIGNPYLIGLRFILLSLSQSPADNAFPFPLDLSILIRVNFMPSLG